MSIKTRIAATALAALAAAGTVASSTGQAQAKGPGPGPGFGIAAGIIGPAVVGSAIAASQADPYDDGYRRCGWVRQYDAYGNYIGRVRTCNY